MRTSPWAAGARPTPGATVPAEEPDQPGWEEQSSLVGVPSITEGRKKRGQSTEHTTLLRSEAPKAHSSFLVLCQFQTIS